MITTTKRLILVFVLLVITVVSVWVIWRTINPQPTIPETTTATDDALQSLVVQMNNLTQKVNDLDTKYGREVRIIHDKVKQEVSVLMPVDVVIELNNELRLYREHATELSTNTE